jgi:hypothetical protein
LHLPRLKKSDIDALSIPSSALPLRTSSPQSRDGHRQADSWRGVRLKHDKSHE